MVLVDTNIFLELLLQQDKKESAGTIFNQIERGDVEAVISGYSLHSIEFILSIKKKHEILRDFLLTLDAFPNLSVYHTTIEEDLRILDIVEQTKLDFDDANQYYIAKKFDAEIITFDNDFKGLKDVKVRLLR